MITNNPNWRLIRSAYVNGEGSLRELSERYGVAKRTLERRCSEERWREQQQALGDVVSSSAVVAAAEAGTAMGERAATFLTRTLNESDKFLDLLQAQAERGCDPRDLRHLIAGWRDVVTMTRATYGMADGGSKAININILSPDPRITASPVIDVEP